MKKRRSWIRFSSYAFLSVSSFIMIYPVLFAFLGAFTTGDRFLNTVFLPIPNTLNLPLFRAGWNAVREAYLFTLARVTFYVGLTLLVGLVGGYIFSKLRFPGKNVVFLLFLCGMVMPAILMIVPMYLLAAWFPLAGGNNIFGRGGHGLIGDWPVLFMYGWVPPLAIFLFKQSYDMLPNEYQDAARIDGSGILSIIFRVYGPLLRPVIVAITIITFLGIWNDYLWPSLTITSTSPYAPISFKIQSVALHVWSPAGLSGYPAVMVQYLMATWPPAAVYFLLQRYFVQGLVASGLKG